MVEYGHGVGEVAGKTSGGGGGALGSGPSDWGGAAVNLASDVVDRVAALPPHGLLILAVIILGGLIVLRRAF